MCRDPEDDKFIDVALAAKADYLVTGDKDLLVLKNYRGVKILKPKEFLALMRK
ncbi:MAG: putative toxin-antitoxin system toxin component, PIN family [Actinomycetota bacterium]|nr:putative toxin-antitoxin system toxin component, PIN family [Actinomycetota bacterium]